MKSADQTLREFAKRIEDLRADILFGEFDADRALDPIAVFHFLRGIAELDLAMRSMQLACAHHQARQLPEPA